MCAAEKNKNKKQENTRETCIQSLRWPVQPKPSHIDAYKRFHCRILSFFFRFYFCFLSLFFLHILCCFHSHNEYALPAIKSSAQAKIKIIYVNECFGANSMENERERERERRGQKCRVNANTRTHRIKRIEIKEATSKNRMEKAPFRQCKSRTTTTTIQVYPYTL